MGGSSPLAVRLNRELAPVTTNPTKRDASAFRLIGAMFFELSLQRSQPLRVLW